MKTLTKPDHIFIGHVATGVLYCDKSKREHGDYKRLAILFDEGGLKFYPGAGLQDRFFILRHAAQQQEQQKQGEGKP